VDASEPCAPGLEARRPARRSFLFLAGSLAGGNFVSMAMTLIGGVLQGRLVAPATLGLFNGIGLVIGYAPFLQLGILNGLNRELPYYVGKGDREKAKELASAAQSWALVVGGVTCLVLFGVAGWHLVRGEWLMAAGWAANAVLTVFLFYNTYYLQMTYRTSQDFARLALFNVIQSAAALLLLVLVAWFGFYGLCMRVVLVGAMSLMLHFHWRPIRVGLAWSGAHLKHLFVIGAPIFGVGQLYTWWAVINSTLVLRFAGTEGMGLYSMVAMATTGLEFIPAAVSTVVYPRMAEQYGRRESVRELVRMARKPMIFSTLGLLPVIVGAMFLVEPVMRLVVPRYVAAAPAMRWAMVIPLITCLSSPFSAFNVVRRQDLYVVAIVVGMAAYGGSLAWLVQGGVELTAFPQAMLIGRSVYTLVSHVFLWHLRRKERARGTPSTQA
jgi:O-antigen/teichoic acid export membrane protein